MESVLYHLHKVISDKDSRQVYSVAPRFSEGARNLVPLVLPG